MAEPALTPELALDYLDELSTDIRAGVLLDEAGAVAANHRGDDARADRLRQLVAELFEAAEEAAAPEEAAQVEVAVADGTVFAVREGGWTLAVVTGRYTLSSLMFYDLRSVLRDLDGAEGR